MIKKTLIIATIALLFCSMIIPSTIAAENNDIKKTASMTSFITVDWETLDEPIMPLDEIKEYNINITYNITKSGFFSSLLLPLFADKQVDINLEIVDKPQWCTANFASNVLTATIGDGVENLTTKLSIKLDETAPAYGSGYVTFNVSVEPVKGPLGLITFIDGFEKEFTFEFEPAYLGLIDPDFTEGAFYEIAPFNETVIPIYIKNFGNGKTEVKIEIVNSSDSFDVVIQDKVILDVNENATIDLIVIADNKFDEEIIRLEFTPAYSENLEDTGTPILMTLVIENDGSYVEEEDGLEIDITLLTIILIIIAFVVVAIIILKRK